MIRRALTVFFLAALVLGAASCSNKKVKNPIANLDSKQPDKVLFDRAMDAMKHNRYDVARMTLQTLINTYPDSEYVARAKLAVGDSWYAEGGAAALAQAEIEYKDFITFFPNMPEAAEAQLKVANIHYQQMEKPDRDFTHAMRAEEEYKQLILQFPDSKLVPEAKQRLREVQEVLAEREFRIGHFYFMREMYPAAIARLESLADAYPLYSQADEALYTLGQSYERQAELIRNAAKLPEKAKEKLIAEYMQKAGAAYTRLITRYPVMDRANDAAARLAALHLPVPTPTPQAIAQNKEEETSRGKTGMVGSVIQNFKHGPDVSASAHVGDPTMVEPQPTDASAMVRDANKAVMAEVSGGGAGSNSVSVERVSSGSGTPGPNQPPPSSDSGTPAAGDSTGTPAGQELTPNSSGTSDSQAAPPPPMTQVNEAAQPAGGNAAQAGSAPAGPKPATPDSKTESSSKSKKKKGLRKLIPF
ncbi:MAG TPA: outer membrane protein assembly factor BamD [Terriglobales bacterium]|nr:outer membrane protein assembly factor BamD [Terriglobales bacterium]